MSLLCLDLLHTESIWPDPGAYPSLVLVFPMEIITLIRLDPAWSRSPRCSPVVALVYHNRPGLSTTCSIHEPLGVGNTLKNSHILVTEVLPAIRTRKLTGVHVSLPLPGN